MRGRSSTSQASHQVAGKLTDEHEVEDLVQDSGQVLSQQSPTIILLIAENAKAPMRTHDIMLNEFLPSLRVVETAPPGVIRQPP